MKTYKVVLHKTDEGIAVGCPELPGCWSQGKDETEALTNIKNAIEEYLIVQKELGRDIDIREIAVAA